MPPFRSVCCRVRGLVLAALCCMPAAGAAQAAPQYLPPGHWTHDAVRRLNGLGVAPPSSDPSLAPMTLQHALHVFSAARETAEAGGRPEIAALASAYADWLVAGRAGAGAQRLRIAAGPVVLRGEMRASQEHNPALDTVSAFHPDVASASVLLEGGGPLPLGLAWSLSAASVGDRLVVPVATISAALGPLDVWAGRQRLHFGVGRSGGVTTGSGWHGAPHLYRSAGGVTGFGIATREPFHFPSFLRVLGPDRIEFAVGRAERAGDVEAPWVVMGRLIGTPFSRRFTLGLNRGAIFGGSDRPVTLRRLFGVLIGEYSGDVDGARSAFENQVLSGVIRYRAPLGRAVPLEVLLEVGADDMAGAISEAPGIVAGFDVAALPGLGQVSLNMEYTRFAAGWEGNLRAWYRNGDFGGSWSDDGRLFGHPLGGHGEEAQVRIGYSAPERGTVVAVTGFTRDRRTYNLYAPEREGRSHGGSLAVEMDGKSGWGLRAWASYEGGADWRTHQVHSALSYRF
jgi:hypothetical protein